MRDAPDAGRGLRDRSLAMAVRTVEIRPMSGSLPGRQAAGGARGPECTRGPGRASVERRGAAVGRVEEVAEHHRVDREDHAAGRAIGQ